MYIYVTNYRRNRFGLLGFISAVLMNKMMVLTFRDTTDVPRLWLLSEPCQSAQTSMLVSMAHSLERSIRPKGRRAILYLYICLLYKGLSK